jgi:hypothetical protein
MSLRVMHCDNPHIVWLLSCREGSTVLSVRLIRIKPFHHPFVLLICSQQSTILRYITSLYRAHSLMALEGSNVAVFVFSLEVTNGAELAKWAEGIKESATRGDRDYLWVDRVLLLFVDLSNRFDCTEIARDTARLLVHLEEGKPFGCIHIGSDRLRWACFTSHNLVGGRTEDLRIEDCGAAREPI